MDVPVHEQLLKLGIWNESQPLRLHLGCGSQRFEGYVQIDLPSPEALVSIDAFGDAVKLKMGARSIDEIRLHHLFEHFDRSTAMALLIRWTLALKIGGQLVIETPDFLHFKFITLNGAAVQNKGMALFPRKIKGRYAMLGRQDYENLFLMYSDNPHFWDETQLLIEPEFPWEFIQIGNCGSPIETEAGWLVVSHGVGAMRKYCIGAFLLDLNDPSKVIGRLREPLIKPNENEREGYVPNVVYSCGSLLFGRQLIVPYAMSDSATTFATVSLDDLLAAME